MRTVIAIYSLLVLLAISEAYRSSSSSPRLPKSKDLGRLEFRMRNRKTPRNGAYWTIWPERTVYYTFSKTVDPRTKGAIYKAMRHIAGLTCVRWQLRKSEPDYVFIRRPAEGCDSSLGMEGGKQYLNLGSGCTDLSTVIHEMLHAMGLEHEQARTDRDKYVNIFWENITPDMESQFEKLYYSKTYGIPYDFTSIMHYQSTAFSENGKPTILPKNGDPYKILNRGTMSESDAAMINAMYGCPDHKATITIPCENNHYGCDDWATYGECTSNPDYMLENCKKSCKVC